MPEAMGRRVPVVQTTWGRYRSASPPSSCQLQLRGAVHQRPPPLSSGAAGVAPHSSSTVLTVCLQLLELEEVECGVEGARAGRVGTVSDPLVPPEHTPVAQESSGAI